MHRFRCRSVRRGSCVARTLPADARIGRADTRSACTDVRFARADFRSSRTDVRSVFTDIRSPRNDFRFGRTDVRFLHAEIRFPGAGAWECDCAALHGLLSGRRDSSRIFSRKLFLELKWVCRLADLVCRTTGRGLWLRSGMQTIDQSALCADDGWFWASNREPVRAGDALGVGVENGATATGR
jgi:hypothetical protein